MEGKKARVFGETLGDFVTATGGAPTLISGLEQYLAYPLSLMAAAMKAMAETLETMKTEDRGDII